MNFSAVRAFLESWGLGFDTPDGDSSTIPYPAVFNRMKKEANRIGGDELSVFVSRVTDTTDSQTYLSADCWEEIRAAYNQHYSHG
jgi:hypothetical protein